LSEATLRDDNAHRAQARRVAQLMAQQHAGARDPYLVKSVVHASRLLSAFRSSGEALPLREVASRSGLPKSMAFRILYTLERCGMVEKVGENLYRSSLRPFRQKLYRLGYAAQGTDYQFSKDVSTSLERAAHRAGSPPSPPRQPFDRLKCRATPSTAFAFRHAKPTELSEPALRDDNALRAQARRVAD